MSEPVLRIAHLNSMLTGGGTDDQCVKLAKGLSELGQDILLRFSGRMATTLL